MVFVCRSRAPAVVEVKPRTGTPKQSRSSTPTAGQHVAAAEHSVFSVEQGVGPSVALSDPVEGSVHDQHSVAQCSSGDSIQV